MGLSKIAVLEYIQKENGSPAEFKKNNDTEYIKFDFLPFKLRELIHSSKDYDESKMVLLPRDCSCGHAYFYESKSFFGICKQIKSIEELN